MTKATLMATMEMLVREALRDGLPPAQVVEVMALISATLVVFNPYPVFADTPARMNGSVPL
jgi:hypothetical protein